MRRSVIVAAAILMGGFLRGQDPGSILEDTPPPSDNYALGPDSLPHPGVPAGKIFKFEIANPKTFPDTVRTITVYVPAQYRPVKPACVYVGLDGLGMNVPTVFDNLIAAHAMPVTIAVGVSPGAVASSKPPEDPRLDRSFEFDSLTDRFARFVLSEVFPAVQNHLTPDGDKIVLSSDPNDRAIGGGSTGGIGAFTVAWERPDAFRRVFTAIGTFVGMRGGERFYVLVRKTEPKPLRIFMQDGVHDEWGGGPEMGDWWMSNQTMARALEFAGYDIRHVWGTGTHNGKHAASVFPDAMRWLWREWPKAIPAPEPGNPRLKEIVEPNQGWQAVADGCSPAAAIASNPEGEVFAPDSSAQRIVPITAADRRCPQVTGGVLAFGSQGQFYLAENRGSWKHRGLQPKRIAKLVAAGLHVRNMTVANNGDLYATTVSGELWLIRANGEKKRLDTGLKQPSGIAFLPDRLWLLVAQSGSRWGYSYRVRPDGALDSKEPFYDFYVPGSADDSGAGAAWMDRKGLAYVATRMGVQIFDRNGRVVAILPMPGNLPATSLCFGGKDFSMLYVLSGGEIYRRKLRATGAPPWEPPIVLPRWGAG